MQKLVSIDFGIIFSLRSGLRPMYPNTCPNCLAFTPAPDVIKFLK
jgi:hypothetical protein